jgi:hypothetical protein
VEVGVVIEEMLDDDLVLPVVAEVIGVAEPVTDAADQLVEPSPALVDESKLGIGYAERRAPREKQCMW